MGSPRPGVSGQSERVTRWSTATLGLRSTTRLPARAGTVRVGLSAEQSDKKKSKKGTVTDDLESRVRRLEDRALISEVVTKYAIAVDRRDWTMFADCFTDPVHADYSENGLAAADFVRDELVAIVRDAVSGYTATQHLSPNHVIAFDDDDPDRAICTSYMYAQHHVDTSEKSEFLLLRGSYSNHMVRTADGWRIERLIQHIGWREAHER
jgi:SnoaL-like domain